MVAPAIDLADAQQYYDANIFLSNFAENWVFSNGYDRASYRMTEVLEWAFMHNALNAPDRLETGTWLIEGTMSGASEEFVGDIGAGGPVFSRRMQTEHITRALERYLGLLPDLAGIDTASDQDYGTFDFVERDGYLYEGVYRGSALFHDNVVICTSAQAEGDNLVRLQFNVYKGGNEAGKVHQDTAWYGFSVQQVEASGGELAWTGEAVVEVRPGDEHPLKLVSMKRH